jgi:hypothetical protein
MYQGLSGGARRRLRREQEAGDDDQHQSAHFQHREEILRHLAFAYARVINPRQHRHHQDGPFRGRVVAQVHDPRHVVAEQVGEHRD